MWGSFRRGYQYVGARRLSHVVVGAGSIVLAFGLTGTTAAAGPGSKVVLEKSKPQQNLIRIDADLLIPGLGEPIQDGVVIMDGKKIVYSGPAALVPTETKDKTKDTKKVPVVLPGLWDCHGHFLGLSSPNLDEFFKTSKVLYGIRGARDAQVAINSGFTSIRELGGLGIYLAKAIEEGTIIGPHIYAAGDILSVTGGHGDFHAYELRCLPDWFSSMCDGIPECLRAVRMQLRKGAKVIKVCASGGVMSELDHPEHQQFSDEELKAIVDEARRADRVVAAHCHGKAGIMAALRAGCKTIEHGTYLDEEVVELMLEKKAILVPTRHVFEVYLDPASLPKIYYDKLMAITDRHKAGIQLAIRRGVPIAMGSDVWAASGLKDKNQWGTNGGELKCLTELGMTPLQAIEAATATAPHTLGPQAPLSGQLKAGYDADVIALDKNPLEDIGVLGNPKHVIGVWKDGVLVKDNLSS